MFDQSTNGSASASKWAAKLMLKMGIQHSDRFHTHFRSPKMDRSRNFFRSKTTTSVNHLQKPRIFPDFFGPISQANAFLSQAPPAQGEAMFPLCQMGAWWGLQAPMHRRDECRQ